MYIECEAKIFRYFFEFLFFFLKPFSKYIKSFYINYYEQNYDISNAIKGIPLRKFPYGEKFYYSFNALFEILILKPKLNGIAIFLSLLKTLIEGGFIGPLEIKYGWSCLK